MLSCIKSSLVDGINDEETLPYYMVIVLDADIVNFLDYDGYGVVALLGKWLKYLAEKIQYYCDKRKKALPLKAMKEDYPVIYWATAPHHRFFRDNHLRAKFNNVLDSTLKLFNNMRTLKMKEVWSYDNPHLVHSSTGIISAYGLSKYWASIDSAIEYNVDKHELFLCKVIRNRILEKNRKKE